MCNGHLATLDKLTGGAHHRNLALCTGTVYKITSPSGKSYIGQTTQRLVCRMRGHRDKPRCYALASAIKKYGWGAMQVEVVASNVSIDQLDAIEDMMIARHGTMSPHGYNLKRVGSQPYKASNHANCREAVRAYNRKNPEAQKAKQNTKAINHKRRASWEAKRMRAIATALQHDPKRARHIIMSAKASAKLAAKNACERCAGTGRDPMAEWEEMWGNVSIDEVIERVRLTI